MRFGGCFGGTSFAKTAAGAGGGTEGFFPPKFGEGGGFPPPILGRFLEGGGPREGRFRDGGGPGGNFFPGASKT